jgi:ubiquinone/menaquinone biosynthesis C-methylase UbiE
LVFAILDSALKPNELVLDAGSGSGEISRYASKLGGKVVSLDISKSYLSRVTRSVNSLVCASSDALPFRSQTFDVVISSDVIEHIPAYNRVLSEVYRVSRKMTVITTPCEGIVRKLYGKLFPDSRVQIDKKVGHLYILPLSNLRQKLLQLNTAPNCRSYHVIQPLADGLIPTSLARVVDFGEKLANVCLHEEGTISLVILIRTEMPNTLQK